MSAVNSGGEAKNIKPMQAWTDLTLPGEGGDTVPFPGPGRGEQAVVSSTFYRSPTESQGADFFFSAAALESQPALAMDEGALSLSPASRGRYLKPADKTRCSHSTPTNAFTLLGMGRSLLAHDFCAAVSIVPGAAPFPEAAPYLDCCAAVAFNVAE